MNFYGIDLTPYIEDYMEKVISVWKDEIECTSLITKESGFERSNLLCDLSVMPLKTPGQPISLDCNMLFMCTNIEVDTTDFKINTDKIFVGQAATIKNIPPQKVRSLFCTLLLLIQPKIHILFKFQIPDILFSSN